MEQGRSSGLLSLGVAIMALMGTSGAANTGAPRTSPDAVQHSQGSDSDLRRLRERAEAEWKRLPAAGRSTAGAITGTVWAPIGPSPIIEKGCCGSAITFAANGRVNSIAVDPTNSDRLYLGASGGGVWKSEDRGSTWTPLTDEQVSLGIGSSHAIAIDPNDPSTIYAGTSSWSLLWPIDASQARGILKSTDGGASWIRLGSGFPTGNDGNAAALFFERNIAAIIVDPAASNILYLAAGRAGDPISGGFFWSIDGGLNWTQGIGTEGMLVESLALDTSSPPGSRVLYAGAFQQGVLKSTDGGQHWTPVLTASTPAVAPVAPNGIDKTMVALAPPATPPNPAGPVVYVSLQLRNTLANLIFENTDGGTEANWVQKNAQVVISANGFDTLAGAGFSDMVVDPASPGDGVNDLIYWGGLSQFLSNDSANTFNEIGQIHGTHGDHQTWLIVPHAGTNTVYAGDDGGIWRSEDQGASWTGTSLTSLGSTINGGSLQVATLYQLAVQQDATAGVTLGGAQDSGLLRLPHPTASPPAWSGTSNDGIDVVFDRIATNVAYCIQNSAFFKSTDDGATWPIDFTSALPPAQVSIFINRLAIDPNNAGFLYVGGSGNVSTPADILQTRDGTTSFRSLGLAAPAYITSLDVAPTNSNNLVAASSNRVFVSTNALASTVGPPSGVVFQDITGDLPTRFVTRVAFDPSDATVAYATLAGYGGGHVFRKTITTFSWTDISPPVDVPVRAIALDGSTVPAVVYIGTDLGVMRTADGGSSWAVVDDPHLPNVAVSDLEINSQAGVLRAATWGRGVFELAAPTGPAIAVAQAALAFGTICSGGADLAIDVSNVGAQNLVINSVARLAGSTAFTVLPTPPTPLTIAPGGQASFTVHFAPTSPGALESAVIRVSSNDPLTPFVDLSARGSLDGEPPAITCPPSLTAFGGPGGALVTFPLPTAIDNCPNVVVGCSATPGSVFPVGTTAVTCVATDTAGNSSFCTFEVTVVAPAVPTLSEIGLAVLGLMLAAAAVLVLRHRG
jgi:hypothetical protein